MKKTVEAIMKKLGATDGKNGKSWDSNVLRDAAERCLAGKSPHDFDGRPELASEQARFAAAWKACQEA